MTDRNLPFSEEGENGVLACILHDPQNSLDTCIAMGVNIDHFFIPAHRMIVASVSEMLAEGKRIDVLTIIEHMKKAGTLDESGGSEYVYKLMDHHITMAYLDEYIGMLKNADTRREIIRACNHGIKSAYDSDDPELLRAECESMFLDMKRNIEVKDTKSIFREIVNEMHKGMSGEPVEIGLPTGFPTLDEYNEGGMRRKGVYWLSGHENTGKTSMKCNIIRNMLLSGRSVGDLTLEMSVRDELERMAGIHCGINCGRVIRGKQSVDLDRLTEAKDLFVNSGRLHIADQENVCTGTELFSWARRMVCKHRVDLITVDYFQLIEVEGNAHMKIEEETTKKSQIVKKIAGVLNVPVLCVAAINSEGKVRGSRMADYDGAGHWRLEDDDGKDFQSSPPDYKRNISLVTQKARYGVPFKRLPLTFTGSTGRFSERGASKQEIDEIDRRLCGMPGSGDFEQPEIF